MREAQGDPRYPIGRFTPPQAVSKDDRKSAMLDLAEMPEQMRNALDGLSELQVDTPYRPQGWTVRQVVHHVADSHMQALQRVRKALTEESPVITAYNEKAWADLHDAHAAPVEWSLELIESLHARWIMLLQSLSEAQWQRSFVHPERGPQTIEGTAMLYSWHSRHHVAHITHLRAQMGW